MKKEITKEYLKDRFVNKTWSYQDIAKETGWSKCYVSKMIGIFNLRRKRNLRDLDLSGRVFGKLKVIKKAPRTNPKLIFWFCSCECGGKSKVSTGNLMSGTTETCGCSHRRLGQQNATWKGATRVSGRSWLVAKTNAAKRGIVFNIDIKYADALFIAQNEKCALTGWPLIFAHDTRQTASLDRIDSLKGYEEGNVQWVHKDVNKSKNVFSQANFIKMCRDVTKNMGNVDLSV